MIMMSKFMIMMSEFMIMMSECMIMMSEFMTMMTQCIYDYDEWISKNLNSSAISCIEFDKDTTFYSISKMKDLLV